MMDNQVPLHVRDDCAGILLPLNRFVLDEPAQCVSCVYNSTLYGLI